MKIYTKTGDGGKTSLFGGDRVSKADLRIEAYGSVDELNAFIGLLRDLEMKESEKAVLENIQVNLFTFGTHLAIPPGKTMNNLPPIDPAASAQLETSIDVMETALPMLKNFILPGGHTSVSYCHIARCVCRRAERAVIRLHELEQVDEKILIYLNRLSDYLFVLARYWSKALEVPELVWKPRS